MAVIISNGNTDLHTASGFYRVEASNMTARSNTELALSTTRSIAVTFANAGNCQGVVIGLAASASGFTRDVTVTLKESGTTRASKTLTAAEICNNTSTTFGRWIVPFTFGTPYAVTTTASVWTIEVSQGSGSNNWGLMTSNGTAPFYAAWCDNAVTFADNDTLICKDIVTVSQTCTIKGTLGTGETAYAAAVTICRSDTPPTKTNNLAKFQLQPAAATTVTIDGVIFLGSHSAIQAGTEASPVPASTPLTIDWKAPTVGTYMGMRIVADSSQTVRASYFFWGEIPTTERFQVTHAATNGDTLFKVADTTEIQTGDKFFVGNYSNTANTTITYYTVTGKTATDVSITPNMVGNKDAGGYAYRANGYGITITRGISSFISFSLGPASNLIFSGVSLWVDNLAAPVLSTLYGSASQSNEDSSYRSEYLFSHCIRGNTANYLVDGYIPPEGITIEYCSGFGCNMQGAMRQLDSWAEVGTLVEYENYGGMTFSNARPAPANGTPVYDIQNCRYENFAFGTLWGKDSIVKNNYFRGGAGGGFQLYLQNFVNCREWSGNTWDGCPTAMRLLNVVANLNMKNEIGLNSPGSTSFIKIDSSAFIINAKLESPDFVPTFNNADRLLWIEGSRFAVVDEDEVANRDYSVQRGGTITRTGTGLPDTTVRTSGGFAMRFEPASATQVVTYEQTVPTGDIENQTMTITCWVYINNAAYYAGTHTKPTLTVDYDNGTEITSVATATAGSWQQLAVTFTPTTGYGQVTMTITGATDATSTNSYFYVDDVNIAYPAGVAVDLGNLDLWADGLPVAPAISTMPSIQGVWDEPLSAHTVPGSFGYFLKKVLTVSKYLGLK